MPGGTVEVPEISFEDEVRLPAQKTAVIVIDMQNDFVKPDGALVVPAASEAVPHIQQLLDAARAHIEELEPYPDVSPRDSRDQRIAELEARLCEREAIIAELPVQL